MLLLSLNEKVHELKNLSIDELTSKIESSNEPFYIVVCGSVGSGKSFIVNKHLPNIDTIDPDKFTMELGDGVYNEKNVAKSMAMVKKAVDDRLNNKQSFLQQGTSANLQATINKLEVAKNKGFITVLLYVDTPIDQAIKQIENRVSTGGHGETIDTKKVENTSAGAKLTFRTLTGVDFDKATVEDIDRVEQALNKTKKTIDAVRKKLDYYVKIDNKY
jgi:predicted ABC-type ATPase